MLASKKGRVSFHYECSPWFVNHTPEEGHICQDIWVVQVGLDEYITIMKKRPFFFINLRKSSGKGGELNWEEEEEMM